MQTMADAYAPVTVIIPTYNRAHYLSGSVASVLDQSYPAQQVIVVDDGSNDHTREVLAPFENRITYLSKANGGKPSAINCALPLATGRYIWVFDDDDVACRDTVERHVGLLEKRPDLAFSFSGAFRSRDGQSPSSDIMEITSVNPVRPFPEGEYFIELLLSCYTAAPAVFVRRSVQESAGPYREDLDRAEDFDMAVKWALKGPAARLDDPTPSYYRRSHDGYRGRAKNRFAYSNNTSLSRRAERDVLRTLHAHISLNHYLPHDYRNTVLDRPLLTVALMRRLAVRLRQGLWSDAVADLQRLDGWPLPTHPLTASSRAYLKTALSDANAVQELVSDADACKLIRYAILSPGLDAIRYDIFRGLYWLTVRGMRERDWRGARAGARAAWRLSTVLSAYGAISERRRARTLR